MFYYVMSALHQNVTVGPGRRIIPGVTMAEHVCSSFSIEMTMVLSVCSLANSLRGVSKYYSTSQLLHYLCIRLVPA